MPALYVYGMQLSGHIMRGFNIMANLKQFKKDLKACSRVFGYVAYSDDDGTEFQLKKTDVIFVFKNYPEDTHVNYRIDVVHNTLYIN